MEQPLRDAQDQRRVRVRRLLQEFGSPQLGDADRTVKVGQISAGFADSFVARVREIATLGRGWILIFVDSHGGSPSEAIRAMNAIRGFLDATMNPIAAFGGLVASAAVFLFAPADYRVAYRGFRMLIHAPFIRTENVRNGTLYSHEAVGNVQEADRLRALVQTEVPILYRHAHGRMREGSIKRMLSREGGDTWLSTQEAKKFGLVDIDHLVQPPASLQELQAVGPQIVHQGIIQFATAFELRHLVSQGPFTLDHALLGKNFHVIVGAPVVYSVGLSKFHTPHLTLNVQASSESGHFLRQLMYSIGTDLGTLARTRRLRRVRQGPFTLDHALLDKNFHVMPILRNILMSNQMVKTALTEDPDVIQVKEQSELASRSMVEMFRPEDIQLEELTELEPSSSGVCVIGINDGCEQLEEIRDRGWLSEYFIEGLLGQETYKHEIRGKVIRKAEYEHVTRHKVSKLLSKIQGNFKRYTFGLANLSLESQEAFELARKGTPRQRIMGAPVVYSVGLSKFHTPHLTINVQASSESDQFLRQMMYSIGTDLGTLARTRRLRRVRQGPFTLDHALLDKNFHVMPILRNILMSNQMVKTALTEDPDVIQVKEQSELASRAMVEKFRLDVKHLEEDAPEPDDCLYLQWGRDYEK